MKKEETTVVENAEVLTDTENQEALAPVADSEEVPATQFDDNDSILIQNISLPTVNDTTSKKVDDTLKAVFDNFSFDEKEDMSLKFASLDEIVDYSKRSMKDIREKQFKNEAQSRTKDAGILVRLWCLCKTWSDTAAQAKKYGAGSVQKLAASLGFSQSYMYSLITVGRKLTKEQVYLLGVRDVGSKVLRDIAAIKDDTVRNAVINDFCESWRDTANTKERDEAKRKLVTAIRIGNSKESFDGDLTANPQPKDSGYTEEVDNILKALNTVKGIMDKLANKETTDTFKAYASNYFMLSTTEGAEVQHQKVMDLAKTVRDICAAAEDNFGTIIQELDSLLAAQITDPE